jgi:hypothetical protein
MVGAADRLPRRVCPITGVRLNQYQKASRLKAHAVKRNKRFPAALSHGSMLSRPTLSS